MVGRPTISGRRAAASTARGTSGTCARLATVRAQVYIFFFLLFFSVFPLLHAWEECELKRREGKANNRVNYIRFGTREIVLCAELASVRVQVIFFLSVFPLVTSCVGRMRIEAKGRKSEKKNKLYPFRNLGNRAMHRTSDRSPPVLFFSAIPLVISRVGSLRIEAKGRCWEFLLRGLEIEHSYIKETFNKSIYIYIYIYIKLHLQLALDTCSHVGCSHKKKEGRAGHRDLSPFAIVHVVTILSMRG